jgi:hypothetical protein
MCLRVVTLVRFISGLLLVGIIQITLRIGTVSHIYFFSSQVGANLVDIGKPKPLDAVRSRRNW